MTVSVLSKQIARSAGTPCIVFELEPLNSFDSIDTILPATLEGEPLDADWWEESDIPSP